MPGLRFLTGFEGLDDDHDAAAAGARLGTGLFVPVGLLVLDISILGCCRDFKQLAGKGEDLGPAAIGKEASVSDAVEPSGQDVEQEPADELTGL